MNDYILTLVGDDLIHIIASLTFRVNTFAKRFDKKEVCKIQNLTFNLLPNIDIQLIQFHKSVIILRLCQTYTYIFHNYLIANVCNKKPENVI